MSPYMVKLGKVRKDGHIYPTGAFVPGVKGSLDDLEPGVVEWVEAGAKKKRAKAKGSD